MLKRTCCQHLLKILFQILFIQRKKHGAKIERFKRKKIFELGNTTDHYVHADRRSIRYIHGFRCFYFERVVRLFDFLPTTAKRTLCGLRLVGSLSRVYPMPREMFANVHRRSLTLKDTVRGDCVIFVVKLHLNGFPCRWIKVKGKNLINSGTKRITIFIHI